ncbi:GntR family transcriptional regulator [Marinomonas epiphytica]
MDWFFEQVSTSKLSPGDRMPSLRNLSKDLGLSLNTIIHGYDILSQEGWIESRPKSGYFVCHRNQAKPANLLVSDSVSLLDESGCSLAWTAMSLRGVLTDQLSALSDTSLVEHDHEFAPLGRGSLSAREAGCQYLKNLGINTHASQLWLGRSPLSFFTQAVLRLTQVQDKVLLLTPSDPRLAATLVSLERQVMTLDVGERGADLDAVLQCLKQESIGLIVLPGQFSFPTGLAISNLSLRRWLAIIEKVDIPAIEWDMYSHLAHKASSVMAYKSLDQEDRVIYIGALEAKSAYASAAWCIAGRYHDKLEGALLGMDMALSEAQQEALVRTFKKEGKSSLTKKARTAWSLMEKAKSLFELHFSDQVSFAQSKGGFILWLKLERAVEEETSKTLMAKFRHCFASGALLSQKAEAKHWLAVNVTSPELNGFIEALAKALAAKDPLVSDQGSEILVDEKTTRIDISSVPSEEVQTNENAASSEEKPQRKSQLDEPVYNPMLDLINHDFG